MAQAPVKDPEAEVRSWGFSTVYTWTDGPYVQETTTPFAFFGTNPCRRWNRNAYYRPHSHAGLTTHLILRGELTITFPDDRSPEKKTYTVGDRIDVEAGRVHEVRMGKEGCTYVIGE